jgi:hypothetical protein
MTGKIIISSGNLQETRVKEKPEHLPNPSTCRIRALAESEHMPEGEPSTCLKWNYVM